MTKPVIIIGTHTISQLQAGQEVELDVAMLLPASDLAYPETLVIGVDRAKDGSETHCEGFWKDGVLHITDFRAISPNTEETFTPAPSTHLVGTIDCPCTTFEQDEDCTVGYPSLLCTACDGKGYAPIDKIVALAAEMMKVAAQVGEPEDPFAAWETIDLVESQRDRLRDALEPFAEAAGRFDGVPVSESLPQQCWFTPQSLREARAALTTEGQP